MDVEGYTKQGWVRVRVRVMVVARGNVHEAVRDAQHDGEYQGRPE